MSDSATDKPALPANSPVADRIVISFPSYAVHTARDNVVQYPQAEGYRIDEHNNLIIVSSQFQDGIVALYDSGEWEAIYHPGAVRVLETFAPETFIAPETFNQDTAGD